MNTTTADPLTTGAFELPENLGLVGQPQAPEDGDAAPAMNPPPGFFDVLREQFGAVGLSLRREGLAVGLCMLILPPCCCCGSSTADRRASPSPSRRGSPRP